MLKIEGKQINITRGDTATLKLRVKTGGDFYTFNRNDEIEFKVYEKKKLENEPVLYKDIMVEEETDKVSIELTSQDTTIGEIINKEKEYWYEIQLNKKTTLIGYSDTEGPAIFMLLPEGREI